MICDLSGENEWWEGERPRETHTERQTERKIYYKTVSWVNHQPFHQSLWEGNESRISTHTQEEQIKLHLLKGVSKNFWPYFKTTVCVCMCGERERERELSTGKGQICLTSFIQSVPTIFLSLIFRCTWANLASIQALEMKVQYQL